MLDDNALKLSHDERARVSALLGQFWGFTSLRPIQEAAIAARLRRRDSLTVLPTGGGKSLCYQVPPLVTGRTHVVVSPLIALMKDQVDGLRECGYPAAAVHSGMSGPERNAVERDLQAGKLRLIFAAPERLPTEPFLRLLGSLETCDFAIDEAHCISHWGHDFRPEYRRLASLRERFPKASFHAFTATATQRVREDIVCQLGLRDAALLVGSFDRPNLVYRIRPRVDLEGQVLEVVRRHANEAVIAYCLSRRDTENLTEFLKEEKVSAEAYHAGLDPQTRRRVQDAFAAEKIDVVVATVAFGMGIDRSNVRCVIHASMPKSIEHYQQETGRAGRDGLEAECLLFYSAEDVMRWESLIAKSAVEAERPEGVVAAIKELLRHMQGYCNRVRCRHQSLVEYFGQTYDRPNCGACDVCLDELEGVVDATLLAQKILSCVARVGERFGVNRVVDVLLGANTEPIRRFGHDQLSTFGLLAGMARKELIALIYQLVDQGVLVRTADDKPILKLNEASWEVMRKQRPVRLVQAREKAAARTRADQDGWEGVDRGLFEHLRAVRTGLAEERSVPAFVVFGDATLRHMARVRPSTLDGLGRVYGIGQQKLAALGELFLMEITSYSRDHGLSTDVAEKPRLREPGPDGRSHNRSRTYKAAIQMFAEGRSIQEVMQTLGRAESTVVEYLAEYIESVKPARIDRWVDDESHRRVSEVTGQIEGDRLKPIFDHLEGMVPYGTIRLVVAHRRALGSA